MGSVNARKYILQETSGSIQTRIDFKASLNEEQFGVVTLAEGPSLVLAGAGSGKTRTLIYRLAYLLERGENPDRILLMTFTNKAAREINDRAEMLLKYKPKGLWSGTFHHIGNRSIRMFADEIGYKKDFGILDSHDSEDLIKSCMKKEARGVSQERFPKASVVQSIISFAMNTGQTIDDVLDEKYSYFAKFSAQIKEINELYNKKKKKSNTMDYDDLLINWKTILDKSKRAFDFFTNKFKYIMVDEYQDTNLIQADIIDRLTGKFRNILVVGDDAQAIYSFRGARVDNILTFPKRFKDTKIFKLETNYRSTPEILALANDSLEKNERQFHKKLKAVNPSMERPALVVVKDLYSQASFVSQRILELRDEGIEMKNMAVLFRAHYQAAELEMELVKRGIPYVVRGGIRFFEQAHIKDILAYLRIVSNAMDEISWLRALTLCPGIGPGYASRIYDHFQEGGYALNNFINSDLSSIIPEKARNGYARFVKIIGALTRSGGKSVPDMIELIMDEGYKAHILATFDNAKDRVDDIHELINFSHDYDSVRDFINDITLRENFRGETIVDESEKDDEFLVLSTIHQAKGLEWDVVMIIGLSEGQFPHGKAMSTDDEMEEERRLFYVSSTRAKKYLYLIHPSTRFDYQMGLVISRKSRFIEEINAKNYDEWEVSSGENSYFDSGESETVEL